MKPGFSDEALPHMDAVYRFALRLGQGRESDAHDLVQETFLRAYRSWDTYKRGTECRSWLFTICRNQFLKSASRLSRTQEIPTSQIDADVESLAASAVFSAVQHADPEKEFFDSFVDEEVMAAIDRLPDTFREAVVLSDLEGMGYPQVSEVLGVPVGTVKSRIFRGRRILQEALYEYALEMGYVGPRGQA
ncbi:MAG: sigma-70 family RNA polymerase sigma factor [Gemmatimonadetes bacterium]|nr:sigma-70 family RNA polymerase sigma factor [Gemmatimonadota bacterium]